MTRFAFFVMMLWMGCSRPSITIPYDASVFRLENHGMTYKGHVFTGTMLHESSAKLRITPYKDGKIHGVVTEFSKNRHLVLRRSPYINGKKVGVHEGFYPSGSRKFRSHYHQGAYDGENIQWYESGQMYSYTLYDTGKLVAHKLWRPNGRIFSNYVYRNGRKLGLDGGKLCFTATDKKEAT